MLHIGQKCKQGRQALEGNPARKFIKSVDLVERELKKEKEEVVIKGLPLLEAAKSFNKVVEGCMGVELQPDWVVFIESFKEKYLATNMSVTPKVHMVFDHIKDFIKLKGDAHGLGYYSKQAMEAQHHDFKTHWEKRKVHPDHPEFGERLKKAVSRYSAMHI